MAAPATTKGYLSDPVHAVLRRRTGWHPKVRSIVFYYLTHTSAAERRRAWCAALAGEPGTFVQAKGHSDASMLAVEVLRLPATSPRANDTAAGWLKRAADEGPLRLTQIGKGNRGAIYRVVIDLAPLAAAPPVSAADRPPKRRRPGDRRGDNVKARQAQATARRKVRERAGGQPPRVPTNTRPRVAAADIGAPESRSSQPTNAERGNANVPPHERESASTCPPTRREPCPPASGTPKTCDSSRFEQQHPSPGAAGALEPPRSRGDLDPLLVVVAWVEDGCPPGAKPASAVLECAERSGLIIEAGPDDWALTHAGERHSQRRPGTP